MSNPKIATQSLEDTGTVVMKKLKSWISTMTIVLTAAPWLVQPLLDLKGPRVVVRAKSAYMKGAAKF